MRTPLEYGDNFPVPSSGSWNPAEPWRFPQHEILPSRSGVWGWLLPWVTLGLGVTLGILWMSWRLAPAAIRFRENLSSGIGGVPQQQEEVLRPSMAPAPVPARVFPKSRLA